MKLDIQLFAVDSSVIIGIDMDTKGFDLEIAATEQKLEGLIEEFKLLESLEPFEGQEEGLLELQEQIEKSRNKLVDLKQKQEDLNNVDTSKMSKGLNKATEEARKLSRVDTSKLGNGLNAITSKITKMGLGIIGVSSLFRMARKATNAYLEGNESTAQKMSAMWTALGNLLGPIIEKIANLIMKLVGYINAFVKVISGGKIDLTKNMNKNTKAAKGTASAIKEANKQLASFDEMNTLSDSSSSGGGGGSDVSTPKLDLSQFDIDGLSTKMEKFYKRVKDIFTKIGEIIKKVWNSEPVQAFIDYIITYGQFLLDFFITLGTDLWNNLSMTWQNIQLDVETALSNMFALWTLFFTDMKDGIEKWGKPIIDGVSNLFNSIWKDAIDPALQIAAKIWADFSKILLDLWTEYGQPLIDNIGEFVTKTIELFQSIWDNVIEPIVTPFLEMLSWLWDKHLKGLVEELGKFIMKLVNGALEIYNKFIQPILTWLLDKLAPAFSFVGSFISGVLGTVLGVISDVAKGIFKALGGIIDFITGIFTGNWKKAWGGVRDVFTGIWDSVIGIFKGVINAVLDVVNAFISGINKIKFDVPDWVPVIGGKKWGFNIPKIPKLARGGIVSNPGPGVMMGNYIAGEGRNPEAVIPLDDYTLDRLGMAFAKHTTINASITNTMNGRIISKELQKINAENDFAYNR